MGLAKKHKEILKLIGTGLIIASAFVAPNILQLLKPRTRQEKHIFKKTLDKMFDDKIIYLSGDEVKLSDEGQKLLQLAQIEEITTLNTSDEWDGVWHLVCYDVPEEFKSARDCLRRKLIELGFEQIQYSLWANPWECREEIAIISQNLGVAPFVAYLNTDHLPKQRHLLEHFGLADL